MISWICGVDTKISVPSFDNYERKNQSIKCSSKASVNSFRYIKRPIDAWIETDDEIGSAHECTKLNYTKSFQITARNGRGSDIDDTYSCPTNRSNLKYCRTNSYSMSLDCSNHVESKKTKFLDWLQMCLWKSSCGCSQLPTVNV